MMTSKVQQERSVQAMITKSRNRKGKKVVEKIIPIALFLAAAISVLTTFGIVFTLIFETFEFFQRVSLTDYLFGTEWFPFSGNEPLYGILPLIIGTLKLHLLPLLVAVPFGLGAAIYLSEYASEKARRID